MTWEEVWKIGHLIKRDHQYKRHEKIDCLVPKHSIFFTVFIYQPIFLVALNRNALQVSICSQIFHLRGSTFGGA